MNPNEVLQRYWGYPQFRPLQEEIIQSVMDRRDTLALLPTGGGKSICFQVPALCMEGICVVVTPLIALMKDQVQQLQKRNIPAVALFSGMSKREIDIALDNCVYGGVKFLYLSPERLKTTLFQERLKKMTVSLLAIDEAHCISQWGYDFRPAYLEIAEIRTALPDVPCIALTATATKEVKADILDKMKLENAAVFQKSFARKNLSYSVFNLENKEAKLLEILQRVSGSSIVYVRTRKRAQEVASFLRSQRISADYYHAGLVAPDRANKQDQWISNRLRVMVATNAFGMGIDKPDVRTVIHMDAPDSLEAYYQEAGRAGRDEKMAFAVALFHKKDVNDLMDRAANTGTSKEEMQRVYQSLANYYKMAVGSHGLESLPFELTEFCHAFAIKPVDGLKALRQLEEIGVIQLSEGVFREPRLHILLSKEELYKFEVANAKFETVLKAALRLYGGDLFQNYVSVRELDIAKLHKQPLNVTRNQLRYLTEQGILDYQPASDSPSITFLVPRMLPVDLPIDVAFLKFRQDNAIKKAKAMADYLESYVLCRTRMLQAYFDEQTEENCGVCDFCLNKKRTSPEAPLHKVQSAIAEGANNLSSLGEALPSYRNEQLIQSVRMLIEDNKVKLENDSFRIHGGDISESH
jgi:ATP-dependent DNA helicase RecQ